MPSIDESVVRGTTSRHKESLDSRVIKLSRVNRSIQQSEVL